MGVELGKDLATELLPAVSGADANVPGSASTQGLVTHLRSLAMSHQQTSS